MAPEAGTSGISAAAPGTVPAEAPAGRRPSARLREWVAVPLGAVGLAVAMTWPTLRHPASTVPQDLFDPLLIAWELAWPGHALVHQPSALWQSNAFHPEPDSFAFTDSLLGYAPLSLVGDGPTAAVVRYNLVYVLVAALALAGGYALARRLGARWPGALVAGVAFAYAPWRLAQAGHLHVLSTGGMALALAALARGHGYSFTRGYRPDEVRPGWAVAGWALAAWQVTIGFGLGLPFGYALGLIGLAAVVGWLTTKRPRLPRALVWADVGGALAFAAVSALMARPYLRVVERHPYARRTEADLTLFSPPLRGFLTAPAESWLWGTEHAAARAALPFPPEMTLLPGVAVAVLAAVGLAVSAWRVRTRVLLAAATVGTVLFGMGTAFLGGEYTYLLLFRHLPGWDAVRTPGRLVVWTTLLLALLAAGAVTGLGDRLAGPAADPRPADPDPAGSRPAGSRPADQPPRPAWPRIVTAVMLVPALLVAVEGLNRTPHPTVPAPPAALRDVRGPLLVLPSDARDQWVMLWSTDGFPRMVNGGSGFTPRSQAEVRRVAERFPDAASVDYLRRLGVRTVVVLRGSVVGTPYAHALTDDVTGLPLRRRDAGDGVVFTLDPR